ncbi:hypothetical protein [Halorubrum sp. JWXQ-INN 858]|uniref:hypothetical protein n=1 Tax=Halorubrum sp. JWXQ-INN 858 TaxID=2690782 RepID=UPI001F2125CF|nr:hypothetical protein [Halorubrum sp. JWXQ-INN 858]
MTSAVAMALLASGDALTQASGWTPGSLDAILDVLLDPTIWLGAAAGGAFGAALGALPAFVFTGFLVIAGVFGGDAAGGAGVDVGFGPVFGPHISFAGGAAAAAYAASKGDVGSGFDYHNAKDITVALGSRPDILAVGAAFGVFGILVEQVLRNGAFPTDPIAFTVVASAIAHRVVFGYSVIGVVSDKANGYMDMGPFEREEMRSDGEVPGDGDKDGTDRLAVEPWLPNMYKWSHVASIGLVAGLAGAYAAIQTGSPFLGFGISAASLLFLNLGIGKIPVTHHMTLPAATAYLATAGTGYSPITALAIAGLFGVLGALVGEAFQRVFYAHGDTHVDPPAASIAITHTFIAILSILGILGSAVWVPGAV